MPKRPFVILLIDDDHHDAVLFTELARDVSPDLDVHHVMNGQEGLRYLEQGRTGNPACPRPHLMLLDLNMPVMDGLTFLKEVKERSPFQLIPVIVLSVSTQAADAERAYQNYASSYLVKPETFEETKALVQVVSAYWKDIVRLPDLGDLGG